MKSAYELAMERLDAADPESARSLSDEQKEALAEASRKYSAKRAEREVFLEGKIREARSRRDASSLEQLQRQFRDEMAMLEEEAETAKEAIRKGL